MCDMVDWESEKNKPLKLRLKHVVLLFIALKGHMT